MRLESWTFLSLLALSAPAGTIACNNAMDDEEGSGGDAGSGSESGGQGGELATGGAAGASAAGGDAGAGNGRPVYLMSTTIFGVDDSRQVYIGLDDTLDGFEFSLDRAREFGGVANYAPIAGALYISSGEEPRITRYQITDNLTWEPDGTISFANFPLTDNANFFSQYGVDDHNWYLPYDGYKRIVWDPLALEITTTMEGSNLAGALGTLLLEPGGNRTGIQYDGAVVQPFFYHDEDWYDFGDVSYAAVYDPETHEEIDLIELPCPGLAVPSLDEEGNAYFSSWDYTPYFALYGAGPATCVARVTSDKKLDADFTTDMTAWTGGRYVMNFRYVRDGWGFADVLYDDELDGDFTGEPDPAVLDQIWDFTHFRLWRIDLKNETAREYTEIEAGSFGWSTVNIDGRTFLFVPKDGGTSTNIYELDAEGHAEFKWEIVGDASMARVR